MTAPLFVVVAWTKAVPLGTGTPTFAIISRARSAFVTSSLAVRRSMSFLVSSFLNVTIICRSRSLPLAMIEEWWSEAFLFVIDAYDGLSEKVTCAKGSALVMNVGWSGGGIMV